MPGCVWGEGVVLAVVYAGIAEGRNAASDYAGKCLSPRRVCVCGGVLDECMVV